MVNFGMLSGGRWDEENDRAWLGSLQIRSYSSLLYPTLEAHNSNECWPPIYASKLMCLCAYVHT